MKKKILFIGFCLVLVFSLTSCEKWWKKLGGGTVSLSLKMESVPDYEGENFAGGNTPHSAAGSTTHSRVIFYRVNDEWDTFLVKVDGQVMGSVPVVAGEKLHCGDPRGLTILLSVGEHTLSVILEGEEFPLEGFKIEYPGLCASCGFGEENKGKK